MILYEFEGKELLKKAGIAVPESQLITRDFLDSGQARMTFQSPVVVKAQVLSGKRADVGGIVIVEDGDGLDQAREMLGKVINNETVTQVLVEQKADIDSEYYLSFSYSQDFRQPVISFSESGGTGIEDRGLTTVPFDVLDPVNSLPSQAKELFGEALLEKVVNLFLDQDCLLLEINPLVKTKSGEWMALDAKIKLDDFAKPRHEDWSFQPRGVPGYSPTANEIAAKKIDEEDYRGTAGSAYFDLPGDIAILSSGGGVSLTALDSLIRAGGKPANFTEYSGNPPKEKVVKLTKIVFNKPNIHGLWVIGTVVANFTDIYETLAGFLEGLREAEKELGTKFDFPIVIRRGGPRVDEAYAMLKEVNDFDLHLLGPETSVAQAAQIMAEKARTYAEQKGGH